jgi:outer membrane protein assembly factor BamB
MKLSKIAKKTIAIWLVLLLILSLIISTNVSAEFKPGDPDNPDGVAYDEFENAIDIIDNNNCNISNGSIKLLNTEFEKTFDRAETPTQIEAWKIASMYFELGNEKIGGLISQFLNPDLIEGEEFDSSEYEDIEDHHEYPVAVVETRAQLGWQDNPIWPMNLFRFDTRYDKDLIDEFELTWRFGEYQNDTNLEEISMWVWSYGHIIPRWINIGNLTYTEAIINAEDGYISKIRRDLNYISNQGFIDMLIVGKPKNKPYETTLYSDYAKLKVTIREGFVPDGNVTSSVIGPTTPTILKGWERVIWSGSKPSKNSYVKIQVLGQDETIIDDLDGNSEGFTYSPIDLTSLDIQKYPKIKLRALLHSYNIEFSPRLNSWGVLWQTTDGFYDSFNYSFRIDESYGVKIEGGDIEVSEFYSDWTIFGKNPDNTRSYIGQETKIGTNKTYWYTSRFSEFGGGFRSPVVKDGKVYIASSDKKVYTFNLTTEDPDEEQFHINESKANFTVDASLAVTDDYIIVATGELGKENKIYALNISDLTNVIDGWEYEEGSGNSICYSSSPTIANERIFITSWSGKFASNPILCYLYSKLNNFLEGTLGFSLGVNNKLIGLDLNGGELWDPISLPASSFSTPAVHNGLVYVGCDNYEGSSLFAFDENTGEEIWNASIGLIGRSSPVVADGKVFVMSREQSLFSLKGNDTVFALDAETGEILWNITIGNNTNVLGNYLRTYGIDNRILTSSPVSTPAYYKGTLFVMSLQGILYALNGDTGGEKWTFNTSEAISGIEIFPYHATSPAVVDNIVYVAFSKNLILEERAYLFALDTKNGEIKWDYEIRDPEYDPSVPQRHVVFASPVVTDGLVLISENRWNSSELKFCGRIQCIGTYEENQMGKVYSVPIHVQKGKWWNKFNATCDNTGKNNTISFSILDENGVVLKSGLNGDDDNITDITKNVIQLYAELEIRSFSEPRPGKGQEGWINLLELPECSIEVKDVETGDIIAGLDTDSAQYYLQYVKQGSSTPVSEWFDAVCDKESGATRTKITAEIAKDLEGIDITELKNITFKIKDLAGNENTSETFQFKLDNVKPSSTIKNAGNYSDKYREVEIEAVGEDDKSGVVSIALYYRPFGSSDWIQYGSKKSPYVWSFENSISDEYEFCTIARDKAGNIEDFPDEGDVSFLFDMNKPYKPDFENYYSFDTLPEFTLTFEDDYKLKSAEYRLVFHGENKWINISKNINKKSYTGNWILSQSDWDRMFEDVLYTMFFRITDICGNQYETPSDLEALNLTKDITPPITADVSLDLSNYEEGGWDDSFTITATLPPEIDYEYVSLKYSYSSDNNKWSDWEQHGDELSEAPFKWDFEAKEGSGYYKFKTTIYNEGEIVESPEKIVNVTIFPTALVTMMIILIVILLVIVVISIKKMKKKL